MAPTPKPQLLKVDRNAIEFDHLSPGRQANAQATLRAMQRSIRLREELKHLGQLCGRYANAVIHDAQHRSI